MNKVVYEVKVTLDDQTSLAKGNDSLSSRVQKSTESSITSNGDGNNIQDNKTNSNDIKEKNNSAVGNAVIGGYALLQEARQVYTFVRDLINTNKTASLYISGDNLSIQTMQRQIAQQDTLTNYIESALTPMLTSSVGKTLGDNFGLGKFGSTLGFAFGLFGMVKNVISTINNYSASIKIFNAQRYQDNYIKSLNAERLVKNSFYYRY